MEKTLFDMKFTSKQLLMESKKCQKKEKEAQKKVFELLKKGDNVRINANASNYRSSRNGFV
jgi:hypothetical protein